MGCGLYRVPNLCEALFIYTWISLSELSCTVATLPTKVCGMCTAKRSETGQSARDAAHTARRGGVRRAQSIPGSA
jgi:hypothetical protein